MRAERPIESRKSARSTSPPWCGLESISNKATMLATSETYLGSPDAWKRTFDVQRTATPTETAATARACSPMAPTA
jgi:hypothetical protein